MSQSYLAIQHDAAQHTRLAALCCLFAASHNPYTLPNYQRFSAAVRALGVPLYTIECAGPGDAFLLPEDGTVLRRRATTLGWHKERLLNILERHVPSRYTKLAWLDADILFQNPSWAWLTEQKLDDSRLLQLLDVARFLNQQGQGPPEVISPEVEVRPGTISAWVRGTAAPYDPIHGTHPGLAWACQRDIWRALGGLCDRVLTMEADGIMSCAFLRHEGGPGQRQGYFAHQDSATSVKAWVTMAGKLVDRYVDFIPGTVDHLWHGPLVRRQYASLRDRLLALGRDLDELACEVPEQALDQPRVACAELQMIYSEYFAQRL